jgi:hypothetical protein
VYRDGAPENIISKPSIPKGFGHSPENFSIPEQRFYGTSMQVQANNKTSYHIGKFPGKF